MSSFTPQQIEDFLQEFFDVVGARQYIGARYVPIFGRAGEDTVEWDDGAPYEPLTVVMHQGVSYVSRRYVPTGIQVTDTDYWVETYRFNAQVEQYRQEVLSFQGQIDQVREDMESGFDQVREDMESDYVPFPDGIQYPKYGTLGQVLTTLTDGETMWDDPVHVTADVAEPLIEAWLDDHPEATTTVQDGSITYSKFAQSALHRFMHGHWRYDNTVSLDDIVDLEVGDFVNSSRPSGLPADFGVQNGLVVTLVNDTGSMRMQLLVGRDNWQYKYCRVYNSVEPSGWKEWVKYYPLQKNSIDASFVVNNSLTFAKLTENTQNMIMHLMPDKYTSADSLDDVASPIYGDFANTSMPSGLPDDFGIQNGMVFTWSNASGSIRTQLLVPRVTYTRLYWRIYTSAEPAGWKPWIPFRLYDEIDIPVDYYGTFGIQRIGETFTRIGSTDDADFFDNAFPWCEMREVNIAVSGGTATFTYAGESGFSYDRDVFVEVPKFYFKRSFIGNVERWLVSAEKKSGFVVEPWFLDDQGNEVDRRYIAKYKMPRMSSGKVSATGLMPQNMVSFSDAKTYLEGKGFDLCGYEAYLALSHLMVIEYGTMNAHAKGIYGISWFTYLTHEECKAAASATNTNTVTIPYTVRNAYLYLGCKVFIDNGTPTFTNERSVTDITVSDNTISVTVSGEPFDVTEGTTRLYAAMQPNGLTDSLTTPNGIQQDVDPHVAAFKYRGIENFFGNLGEFMDGIGFNESTMKFTIDGNDFGSATTPSTDYADQNNGAISAIFLTDNPALTLPIRAGNRFDRHYFSEFSKFGSTNVVHSCAWDHYVANNIMTLRIVGAGANGLYGARAEYRG